MACTSAGDVAISQGMKLVGSTGAGLFKFYTLLGIGLHACFLLTYLFALSREQLSFVLPVTGMDYIFVAILASVWAGEDIGAMRWAGSLLVSAGVALVARS